VENHSVSTLIANHTCMPFRSKANTDQSSQCSTTDLCPCLH